MVGVVVGLALLPSYLQLRAQNSGAPVIPGTVLVAIGRVPVPGLGRGGRDVAGRTAHRAGVPRLQAARRDVRRPAPRVAPQRVAASLRGGGDDRRADRDRVRHRDGLVARPGPGLAWDRPVGRLPRATSWPRRSTTRSSSSGSARSPSRWSASGWPWPSERVRPTAIEDAGDATARTPRSSRRASRPHRARRSPRATPDLEPRGAASRRAEPVDGATLAGHADQPPAHRRSGLRGRARARRDRAAPTPRRRQPRPGDRTARRRSRPVRRRPVPGPGPADPGRARPVGRAPRATGHRPRHLGRDRLPPPLLRPRPGGSRQSAGQPARPGAVGRAARGRPAASRWGGVLVCIPAFDEADSLPGVLAEVPTEVAGLADPRPGHRRRLARRGRPTSPGPRAPTSSATRSTAARAPRSRPATSSPSGSASTSSSRSTPTASTIRRR